MIDRQARINRAACSGVPEHGGRRADAACPRKRHAAGAPPPGRAIAVAGFSSRARPTRASASGRSSVCGWTRWCSASCNPAIARCAAGLVRARRARQSAAVAAAPHGAHRESQVQQPHRARLPGPEPARSPLRPRRRDDDVAAGHEDLPADQREPHAAKWVADTIGDVEIERLARKPIDVAAAASTATASSARSSRSSWPARSAASPNLRASPEAGQPRRAHARALRDHRSRGSRISSRVPFPRPVPPTHHRPQTDATPTPPLRLIPRSPDRSHEPFSLE